MSSIDSRAKRIEEIITEAVAEERQRVLGHIDALRAHAGNPERAGTKIRTTTLDDVRALVEGGE